jgi:hypothetical protein
MILLIYIYEKINMVLDGFWMEEMDWGNKNIMSLNDKELQGQNIV